MGECKDNGSAVLIIVTSLDDDDFRDIADNLESPENVLFVADKASIGNFPLSKINCIATDFTDIINIVNNAKAWCASNCLRFSGIIGLDEEYNYSITAELAGKLGLRYYQKSTLDNCSNKFIQKVRLKSAGVNAGEFQLINKETRQFKLGFPNVLKIISGFASIDVYLNNNRDELLENIEAIRRHAAGDEDDLMFSQKIGPDGEKLDPKSDFLLEEYIPGEEFSCDYIISKEDVHVLRVVKKITDNMNFGGFEGFFLCNPDEHDFGFSLKELENLCSMIAIALGIEFGVCMLDFKFHNGKLFVLETTVRPGIATFVELMAKVYGYTSMNKLIRQKLNLPLNLGIPSKTGLVAYFSTGKRGIVKNIDISGLEKNRERLGLLDFGVYYYNGEPIADTSTCKTPQKLLGFALLRDVAFSEINKKLNEIRSLVKEDIAK